MSEFENIKLETVSGVTTLTLSRPATLNSLSRTLLREVITALDQLKDDPETRVLLLKGEGRGFSSGADLSSGASPAGSPGYDAGEVLEQLYNPLIERMAAFPKPIVAQLHGAVAGAATMLALSADIVIAGKSAFFLQAFINLGLVPDAGSMWILPRLIGKPRALAMMMLGERIPAEKALEWGLVYDVVDDEALDARVAEITTKFANGPTFAYGLIRQSVRASLDQPLSQALWTERVAQRAAGHSADFLEGVNSFREKRKPVFTGK